MRNTLIPDGVALLAPRRGAFANSQAGNASELAPEVLPVPGSRAGSPGNLFAPLPFVPESIKAEPQAPPGMLLDRLSMSSLVTPT